MASKHQGPLTGRSRKRFLEFRSQCINRILFRSLRGYAVHPFAFLKRNLRDSISQLPKAAAGGGRLRDHLRAYITCCCCRVTLLPPRQHKQNKPWPRDDRVRVALRRQICPAAAPLRPRARVGALYARQGGKGRPERGGWKAWEEEKVWKGRC